VIPSVVKNQGLASCVIGDVKCHTKIVKTIYPLYEGKTEDWSSSNSNGGKEGRDGTIMGNTLHDSPGGTYPCNRLCFSSVTQTMGNILKRHL
jgi:hypothetical protein